MIELYLLGAIDLRSRDGPPVETALRGSKRVAVLAYLAAARPRGYHRRDKLTALFWPELANERARGALRTTLARLRDDLGADVFLSRGPTEIAVDPTLVSCDVRLLDAALEDGRVSDAADLYRGDFFDGVHIEGVAEELELWISAERARIRNALVAAIVDHASRAESRSDAAEAIQLLRRARSLEPGDETAARALIRLLIAAGDRGSALREFDDLALRLEREFQVEPSDETRRLVEGLRSSEPRGRAPSVAAGSPHGKTSRASALEVDPDHLGAASAGAASPAKRPVRRLAAILATVVVLAGAAVSLARPRTGVSPSPASPVAHWAKLAAPGGERPPWRALTNVLLDSTGDALIMMYGMAAGADVAHSPLLDDVWRLRSLRPNEIPIWSRLEVATGAKPAPRWGFALAYDAASDRAIMHGGALGHSSPCASDTWILDHASGIGALPRWKQVRTTGSLPQAHGSVDGVFDPASRRLIVFGGHDCFATYFSDVWVLAFDDSTLSSGRWTPLTPDSTVGGAPRRVGNVAAYDRRENRLYVQGGISGSTIVSDLWVLDHANGLGGKPAWRSLHCGGGEPPALAEHLGILDDSSHTLVLIAGYDPQHVEHNALWRITGLGGGGARCTWERWASVDPAPRARTGALGVVPRGSNSIVLMGGMVEGFGILDLWRLNEPFGNARNR